MRNKMINLLVLLLLFSVMGLALAKDMSTSSDSEGLSTGESNSEGQDKWCDNCGKLVPVNNKVAGSGKEIEADPANFSKGSTDTSQH